MAPVVVARFRRRWFALWLVVGLGFTALGVSLLLRERPRDLADAVEGASRRVVPSFATGFGLLVTVGAAGLLGLRRPAVAYDDEGLLLGTMAFAQPLRVPWAEVGSIGVRDDIPSAHPFKMRERALAIDLADVERFLRRDEVGFFMRWGIRSSALARYPHLSVGQSVLLEPLDQVVHQLQDELAKRAAPDPG